MTLPIEVAALVLVAALLHAAWNAMVKVSDLFVRCLEAEGVKRIFGVPGEENEDLLFSMENSSIQFVPTSV